MASRGAYGATLTLWTPRTPHLAPPSNTVFTTTNISHQKLPITTPDTDFTEVQFLATAHTHFVGLDRLLPLPKPQVQRRIIFSASLRGRGRIKVPMLLSCPDRARHLNLFTLIEKQCYHCTHTFTWKSSLAFSLCFCSVAKGKHEQLQIRFHKNANFSNSKYFEFYSFSSSLFWSPSLSHPMFRKQPEPKKSG